MTNQKNLKEHKRIPKDVDPKIKNALGFLLGAAMIGLLIWLSSCQKESSFTAPNGVIENDHALKPTEGYSLTKRVYVPGELAKGQGKGKGHGKPVFPPTDTTTYQPPSVSGAVLYLDFDGQYVSGTWNAGACAPSNLTPDEQAQILQRVQADYAGFSVTVTTDSTLYWNAPATRRMRVIITESWEWYGQAGGVAYIGSFTWGDNTPCFVFPSLLSYSVKYVADAVSHEAGHTLGNRHQSKWDGGVKVSEYNPDIAADGKGYLMGYPYDKVSGWQVGLNSIGATQDDRANINATLNK